MTDQLLPILYLDEVDSTNTYAMKLARERSDAAALCILARYQSAGRGRAGRNWVARKDSALLCSFLFQTRERPTLEELAAYPVAVALSAKQALKSKFDLEAFLKWPNDLVVEERARSVKLGGVLSEHEEVEKGRRFAVVVGIGINLVLPPLSSPERQELHASLGREVAAVSDKVEVTDGWHAAKELATEMAKALSPLAEKPPSLVELKDSYKAALSTLSRQVKVSLANGEELIGRAVSIGDRGELLLQVGGSELKVEVGDVEHLFEEEGA